MGIHNYLPNKLLFCFSFLFLLLNTPQNTLANKLWSDPASWPDGKVPAAGENVTIPHGETLLLDVHTPELGSLTIDGTLIFAEKDISITARWIWVRGQLQAGTADAPYRHQAVITLTGPKEDVMGMGGRFLVVSDVGSLQLFGAAGAKRSWTQLAAHAKPGDTQIQLADTPEHWQTGDKIAIAPSGYDPFETEEVTITSVNGKTVSFTPALQFSHWGSLQTYEGKLLDERAEVGMLSRNIVIRGADDSEALDYGGHTMIMGNTGPIQLEGVEFRLMGQPGEAARYSMHWHFSGKRSGDYIKNCSVHHGLQRGIVLHGTDEVLVESNVVYHVRNHAFIPAEDGNEVNNQFINNLSMLTLLPKEGQFAFPKSGRETTQSTQGEHRPSGFWLRNVHNILIGNHAAGAERGNGFFYDKAHRHRDFRHFDVLPQDIVFVDNVAHTNSVPGNARNEGVANHALYGQVGHGMGLFIDDFNNGDLRWTFQHFTGYKNGMAAVWCEMEDVLLTEFILADNPIALTSGPAPVENTIVIGQSTNLTGNPHRYLRRGHHQAGYYTVAQGGSKQPRLRNVTFINMNDGALSEAAAIIADYKLSVKGNHLENIKLINSRPVFMDTGGSPGKQPNGTFLNDTDGSLSGYGQSVIIVPGTSPLIRSEYTEHAEWNGFVSGKDPLLRLEIHELNYKYRFILEQENGQENYQSGNITKLFNIRAEEVYKWRKDDEEAPKEELPLVLRSMTQKAGQWAAFDIPYPFSSASIQLPNGELIPRYSSKMLVMNSEVNAFYFDQNNKTILLKLFTGDNGEQAATINSNGQEITDPDGSTHTHSLLSNFNWQLTPNPVVLDGQISYELPLAMPVRISLHDVLGKEMMVLQDQEQPRGKHQFKFPVDKLAAGVYFIRFEPGNQSYSVRLIRQHP